MMFSALQLLSDLFVVLTCAAVGLAKMSTGYLILAPQRQDFQKILTPEALQLVAHLARRFSPRYTVQLPPVWRF